MLDAINFQTMNMRKKKLLFIKEKGILPDMMMDLSLVNLPTPLFYIIRDDLGLPLGQCYLIMVSKKNRDFHGK